MEGKRIKALFLDLDGTLLADDKSVPPVNREAIDEMLEKGHKVIIATGRPLVSARLQAEKLGLTARDCYLIAFNGGILYDIAEEREISRWPIPLDTVVRAFDEAERRRLHIQTYGGEKVVTVPRCDGDALRLYCERIIVEPQILPDIRELGEEPCKMLAIDLEDHEALEDFRFWLRSEMGDELDAFFSNSQYLEIVPKGLNKGTAILKMAELLGICREDTVAAGDEANDVAMIRAAGVGCAMKNGTEEAKAAADYVTERDNNGGGVAEIIRKFIL